MVLATSVLTCGYSLATYSIQLQLTLNVMSACDTSCEDCIQVYPLYLYYKPRNMLSVDHG